MAAKAKKLTRTAGRAEEEPFPSVKLVESDKAKSLHAAETSEPRKGGSAPTDCQ